MVEETRAKLLGAARKAFAEKGYSGASMDDLTAAVGLTRGALYHNFGDKTGLLRAVIDQLDAEMLARAALARAAQPTLWDGFLAEGLSWIESALDPEVRRIMLLDGPAVLGDPSGWENQTACLRASTATLAQLQAEGVVAPGIDPEAAARLINGAALQAALWIAAAEAPGPVHDRATQAFRVLVGGLRAVG